MERKSVDSFLVQPLIIALGRSDNHVLLARHARAMGVEYLGFEPFEAKDLIQEISRWRTKLASVTDFRPVILAAIDSSISPSLLRSFAQSLERETGVAISLRTDPTFLESTFLESTRPQSDGVDRDFLYALSIARSPHGQISIWPVIRIDRDGGAQPIIDEGSLAHDGADSIEKLHEFTADIIDRLSKDNFVGLMTYVVDLIENECENECENQIEKQVVRQEFGAASITFWSESACYTSASEQLVRTLLDLPLGDARLIDFEEFFMQEEFDLPAGAISDPIRPFLHLFARNPRLKVSYPTNSEWRRCVISLFASSENEGVSEMAHARDFMLGNDFDVDR